MAENECKLHGKLQNWSFPLLFGQAIFVQRFHCVFDNNRVAIAENIEKFSNKRVFEQRVLKINVSDFSNNRVGPVETMEFGF